MPIHQYARLRRNKIENSCGEVCIYLTPKNRKIDIIKVTKMICCRLSVGKWFWFWFWFFIDSDKISSQTRRLIADKKCVKRCVCSPLADDGEHFLIVSGIVCSFNMLSLEFFLSPITSEILVLLIEWYFVIDSSEWIVNIIKIASKNVCLIRSLRKNCNIYESVYYCLSTIKSPICGEYRKIMTKISNADSADANEEGIWSTHERANCQKFVSFD